MPSEPKLYQAKEFAMKAGVTVRTLHFYDRLGLLAPTARTESGYRLYGEADLERLEQILALRFVGFELERIKHLMDGTPRPLGVALRLQREVIAQEKRRLETALAAIDQAEAALQTSGTDAERWRAVQHIIEAFKMKNDWSWTENYYSPEALEKLAETRRTTPSEAIEAGQRAWAELIAEVEDAVAKHEDPSSAHAAELARRWHDLIGQFTQGDPNVAQGLNKLYADRTHWPKDFKRPFSDAAAEFIKRAAQKRE